MQVNDEIGLELTGTCILVRPPLMEETSTGGIVLVADTIEKQERAATTGILIAAALDAWDVPQMKGVKIGDNLFYARYAGDNVPFTKDGVKYKVMNATDVVGILRLGLPDSPFRPAQGQVETYGIQDAVGI